MLRLLFATLALVLAAPAPAGATAQGRCVPHRGERVLRSTSLAVVVRAPGPRIIGCLRRTGARRLLWHALRGTGYSEDSFRLLAMQGPRVLLVDAWHADGDGTEVLYARDLRWRVHHEQEWVAVLGDRDSGQEGTTAEFRAGALRRDGTVAWTQREHLERAVKVRLPGGAIRTLDRGLGIARLRLRGATVHWTHGGVADSAPLIPRDRCPRRFASGTQELGVDGATVCARATGTTVTLPGPPTRLAGTRAAAYDQDRLVVADAASGRVEDLEGPDSLRFVDQLTFDLDAHGSVVWRMHSWWDVKAQHFAEPDVLTVRDARGVRRVAIAEAVRDVVLDGSTLHWEQTGLRGHQQLELAASDGAPTASARAVPARARAAASVARAARSALSGCAPKRKQEVVARSAEAVLLVGPDWRLTGCSRTTGKRRVIYEAEHDFTAWGSFHVEELVGTTVLLTVSGADQYDSYGPLLLVDDAVRGDRRGLLGGDEVVTAVAARDGSALWLATGAPTLRLWMHTPFGTQRLVDEGLDLAGLRIAGATARWSHSGQERSAALDRQDRCSGDFRLGGEDVGVGWVANRFTACERTSGRTVAATAADPRGTWAVAGTCVAFTTDGGDVSVLDPRAGTETWAGHDEHARTLAVNAAGSVSWLSRAALDRPTVVMAHDAAGTREVGALPAKVEGFDRPLGLDGAKLVWPGEGTALQETTLTP